MKFLEALDAILDGVIVGLISAAVVLNLYLVMFR